MNVYLGWGLVLSPVLLVLVGWAAGELARPARALVFWSIPAAATLLAVTVEHPAPWLFAVAVIAVGYVSWLASAWMDRPRPDSAHGLVEVRDWGWDETDGWIVDIAPGRLDPERRRPDPEPPGWLDEGRWPPLHGQRCRCGAAAYRERPDGSVWCLPCDAAHPHGVDTGARS